MRQFPKLTENMDPEELKKLQEEMGSSPLSQALNAIQGGGGGGATPTPPPKKQLPAGSSKQH